MAKGFLEGWLDSVVEKASKIIAEEAVPALHKLDQVCDLVEKEAASIKERSEVLVEEAKAEKAKALRKKAGIIDAEVVSDEPALETKEGQ